MFGLIEPEELDMTTKEKELAVIATGVQIDLGKQVTAMGEKCSKSLAEY